MPRATSPTPPAAAFIASTTDTLREVLRSLVDEAVQRIIAAQDAGARVISANQLRSRGRCRSEVVTAALASGAIPAQQYGTNPECPRWRIRVSDADAWIAAGCPTTQSARA